MEVRNLKFKDIFPMSRIIKKIGIKEMLKQATQGLTGKESTKDAQMKVGTDIIAVLLENLHLAENEVTEFLADLVGVEPKVLSELEFDEMAGILEQFKNLPGLSSFLKQASQ